jgi:hypothetical protein
VKRKKVIERELLFKFLDKMENLKSINDIKVLHEQIDKAIKFFNEEIINTDRGVYEIILLQI